MPLAAFLFLPLAGRSIGDRSHLVGIPAVGGSFVLSVAGLFQIAGHGPLEIPVYELLQVGSLRIVVGLWLDQLAAVVLVLVTGVSFIVHVYSARYMIGDPRYRRFFALIGLFTGAMALLVLSNNLLVTYMCWELMGICSYLLISHWAGRVAAARAATKSFLVNAVADVGLGFGVVLAFATYGTLDIREILAQAASMSGETISLLGVEIGRNTLITLCLLSGAMGKSAQFPLHVWLPYAMEAPTPVSALIHAATMVNAGPFLLIRLSPLVMLAPSAMVAIAVVGAATALYGALVSLTQSDIKRLLAYSTISQIGFMVFACGVGAFTAAVFHLVAHGFLKGFLFLSTGNSLWQASHGHGTAMDGESGSRRLAVGALVLACIPPLLLFTGPYERLWTAQHTEGARAAFWVIALLAVFTTASYTYRAVQRLFSPRVAGAAPKLFAANKLPVVALMTLGGAALMLPLWSRFTEFLGPVVGQGGLSAPPRAAGISTGLGVALATALAGWLLAHVRHRRPVAKPLQQRPWVMRLYVLFLNQLYIDELHRACVVRPLLRMAVWLRHYVEAIFLEQVLLRAGAVRLTLRLSGGMRRRLEEAVIEGTIQRLASLAIGISAWQFRIIDLRGVDSAGQRAAFAAVASARALQRREPRTVRSNLLIAVCGLVLVIGLAYWWIAG
ncbi:MAG: NADH-quinone oxidoreductase subunit L [Bryobacterales bacterium]|nr:NADH-quinone oxidoreductase subunit L [Bryobacterales bacterium]